MKDPRIARIGKMWWDENDVLHVEGNFPPELLLRAILYAPAPWPENTGWAPGTQRHRI